tara:strand:+ start:310 stop:543 length:234 start_codon:yes stop_codon:yes gene_type:complete
MEDTPSAAEIAQHYRASMDSVNLINRLVAISSLEDEDKDTIDRNVRHLEGSKAQSYWTSEDLSPFAAAITAGKAKIA